MVRLMIITAAILLNFPLRAPTTAVCGRSLGAEERYIVAPSAPRPLWLHTGCALPMACRLVAEWRSAPVAAEHEL
jgi:hypothetical protein